MHTENTDTLHTHTHRHKPTKCTPQLHKTRPHICTYADPLIHARVYMHTQDIHIYTHRTHLHTPCMHTKPTNTYVCTANAQIYMHTHTHSPVTYACTLHLYTQEHSPVVCTCCGTGHISVVHRAPAGCSWTPQHPLPGASWWLRGVARLWCRRVGTLDVDDYPNSSSSEPNSPSRLFQICLNLAFLQCTRDGHVEVALKFL